MPITTEAQALAILDDPNQDALSREAAARYLENHPDPHIRGRLVRALQDDDEGVRWAAAEALARLGEQALPELLQALTDPDRVGDPRLREVAHYTLRHGYYPSVSVAALVKALDGPTADIETMLQANQVRQQLDARGK